MTDSEKEEYAEMQRLAGIDPVELSKFKEHETEYKLTTKDKMTMVCISPIVIVGIVLVFSIDWCSYKLTGKELILRK